MESHSDFFHTQEFATIVTIDGKVVPGIFENQYVEYGDIAGTKPTVLCQSNQVFEVEIGDSIVIHNKQYTIAGTQPDGTGLTLLVLNEA